MNHLEISVSEPMLVQHTEGPLFVSGWGRSEVQPLLWKSLDGGSSWERVDVGTTPSDEFGGADVDLAVGPRGTLYFVAQGYDREAGRGLSIAMGVSTDVGSTWTWTHLSKGKNEDRPWVEVGPDGTAHVVWSDEEGVHHARSVDRGETWVESPLVHRRGGTSHFAVGPAGELAVRIKPWSMLVYHEGADLLALSEDGGQTWEPLAVPGTREWNDNNFVTADGVRRWVEPVAWDAEGALHYLWSEGKVLRLARSTDRGSTWTTWNVAYEEEGTMYFPYLIARDAGELAATWFETEGDSLYAHAALIDVPAEPGVDATPRWTDSFTPDSWWWTGDRLNSAGEYFPIAFLSDGALGVVTAIRNFNASRHGFAWRRITAH